MRAALALVGFLAMGWPGQAQTDQPRSLLRGSFLAGVERFHAACDSLEEVNDSRLLFRSAAQLFGDALRARHRSSGVYLNKGNAHFLADELPQAILAFRNGLLIDANHARLAENLDFARSQVQYPYGTRGLPPGDDWPPWLYRPSLNQWLLAALVLYTVACFLGVRWLMHRRRARLAQAGLLLGLACLCATSAWQSQRMLDREIAQPIVVIAEDRTPFLIGNGLSYPRHPDLPYLARGMEARRLHERGDWLQIQFATGEMGWLPRAATLVNDCP